MANRESSNRSAGLRSYSHLVENSPDTRQQYQDCILAVSSKPGTGNISSKKLRAHERQLAFYNLRNAHHFNSFEQENALPRKVFANDDEIQKREEIFNLEKLGNSATRKRYRNFQNSSSADGFDIVTNKPKQSLPTTKRERSNDSIDDNPYMSVQATSRINADSSVLTDQT